MSNKDRWIALAEQCDRARNLYWDARDSGCCVEQAWQQYQEARKAEHDALFAYLAS